MAAKRYYSESIRFDAKSPEGYIRAEAPITKVGVFPYRQADGTVIREYRPASEVMKASSMASLSNLPIQVDHVAFLDANNMQALKVGQTGEKIRADFPYIMANLIVDTEKGISAAEAGKNQLSCGYWCDLEMRAGVTDDGEAFDAIQTNIRYNHLALCEQARLGPELQIQVDRADGDNIAFHQPGAFRRDSEDTMKKVKLSNGLEYDAAPEVAVEMDSLRAEFAAANEKAKADSATWAQEKAAMQTKVDTAEATAATEKQKAVDLQKKVDSFPTTIAEGVKARAKLEADARPVLGNIDFGTKTDSDIRREVILKKAPSLKLDGKSDESISTIFETVMATASTDADDKNRQSTAKNFNSDSGEERKDADKVLEDAETNFKKNPYTPAAK